MYYTKIYAVFFFFEEMAEEYMNSVQEEKERIEAEKEKNRLPLAPDT